MGFWGSAKGKWTEADMPTDLSDVTVVITGANAGLGEQSAKVFAQKQATVLMGCRSVERGESAKQRILSQVPEAKLQVLALDLGDLASVKSFASQVTKQNVNILLNNAGIMAVPFQLTKDGFESQVGVNHLGHFALTSLLFHHLKPSAKTGLCRIVNVSSLAHKHAGPVDFENNFNIQDEKKYSRTNTYAVSKLSNLYFTYELDRRLKKKQGNQVTVAACHPGVSNTELSAKVGQLSGSLLDKMIMGLSPLISQGVEYGALPQLFAAVSDTISGGEYIGPDGWFNTQGYPIVLASSESSHNQENAEKLWEISEKLTGCKFSI